MKKLLLLAALFPVAALAQGYGQAENLIGAYGEVVGTPSSVTANAPGYSAYASGGNTAGGGGVFADGVNNSLFFTHLGFNYADGAPIAGGSVTVNNVSASGSGANGHSWQFNLRFGKLFPVSSMLAVGPYLAYQYADFRVGVNGYGSAYYRNNAIGGGLQVATNTGGPFDLTGHIGYLAGVSSSAGDSAGAATNPPNAGVLQIGARGVYAFNPEFSAFAGVAYDRYHASDSYAPDQITGSATINEVRGMFGLAYHFG